MVSPVSIPSFQKCVDIFGKEEGQAIHRRLIEVDFRYARTLEEQIKFLHNIRPNITVRVIVKLLGISNKSYYKAIRNEAVESKIPIPPSRQLLTNDEEEKILSQIHSQQLQNDCWTGKDIRDAASLIYKERTGIDRSFSRDWLANFVARHEDFIKKVKAACIDDSRASINPNEVQKYINAIEEMMKNPPNPHLLINFDETGFGRRPDKGKRKNVFIYKNCNVEAFWREQVDLHHISLVAAISAACTSIRPLCLSPRKTMDPDLDDTFFEHWGSHFYTPKGYMNIDAMVFWVQNHLAPYVRHIRSIIGENSPCVIIADGCTSHFHQRVMDALNQIGNINVIPLPPHSSHLSQMLDASIFGALKKRYAALSGDKSYESRFTRKLMRIKKAYQSCMNEELIRSSWEATGFKLNVSKGRVCGYPFSDDFKSLLKAEAEHQEP